MPATDAPLPSIVLVDDHIVVRNGLAELIEIMGQYRVGAQYSNGQELIDALTGGSPIPDLILMDLTMPVLDGAQTVIRMKELSLDIPVLILTLNTDEATILRLYRLGIRGYLSKDCTAAGLRDAIEDVLRRGYHHSDMLHKALMNAGQETGQPVVPERDSIIRKLTPRELQFLRLVCNEEEYTYEQMAGAMGVSRRTVDGYRESVFDKFGIRSKTGLVLFATRHRLLDN